MELLSKEFADGGALAALQWAAEVSMRGLPLEPPESCPATLEELRALSVQALRGCVDRLLLGDHVENGLEALRMTGALDVWLPEVATLVGFGDGEWRHKDIWKHTKQVVRQAPARLAVRWGALLHDIGKPKTRRVEPNGDVHFFGHSELGASMYRKRIAKRLAFEDELSARIHFLILHHLRASQYDGSWTDSAVRRFAREMGDGLEDLLDLSRADITTKRPERRRRGIQQIEKLAERVTEVRALDSRVAPLPKGLGTALMEAFGVAPSKQLGDIKKEIERAVEATELEPGQEAEYYVRWVREHRSRLGL